MHKHLGSFVLSTALVDKLNLSSAKLFRSGRGYEAILNGNGVCVIQCKGCNKPLSPRTSSCASMAARQLLKLWLLSWGA